MPWRGLAAWGFPLAGNLDASEGEGRGDFCVCREGAAGVAGDRQAPSLNQRNYS